MLKRKEIFLLLSLTVAAILLHGYHPWAEDAEIYIPGVLRSLNPQLFPHDRPFFESHAHLTLFPNLVAGLVGVTHLPMEWVLLLGQFASVFLFLYACWRLSGICFSDSAARCAGVMSVAALLTLPVAGTALYLMDQYFNPRNIAAFAAIFAVVATLERRYVHACLWLLFAASVHPLMAVFACSYCVLLPLVKAVNVRIEHATPAFAGMMLVTPFLGELQTPSPAYRAAAAFHSFHYVTRWAWYEVVGAIAPALIFWLFARLARKRQRPALELLCRSLVVYDLVYFVAAVILAIPARFESLARIQPLRSLHLLYGLLILIGGGLLGEFLLKTRAWRWVLVFLPICGGMFAAQVQLFGTSDHVEMPWTAPKNDYEQAFLWVRQNTSTDALFALDPGFLHAPGEDSQGFRAIAQRSRLADDFKDSGAVSMFPALAEEWYAQTEALKNWQSFGKSDFQQLRQRYGVSWVAVQRPQPMDLDCPYQNRTVSVCKIQ
ncbi:MAG TPA: hypothetical protein VFA68_05290 [Terriglobales bacterium]|nr:hypothetical protein [Terriglobales bacterium]